MGAFIISVHKCGLRFSVSSKKTCCQTTSPCKYTLSAVTIYCKNAHTNKELLKIVTFKEKGLAHKKTPIIVGNPYSKVGVCYGGKQSH